MFFYLFSCPNPSFSLFLYVSTAPRGRAGDGLILAGCGTELGAGTALLGAPSSASLPAAVLGVLPTGQLLLWVNYLCWALFILLLHSFFVFISLQYSQLEYPNENVKVRNHKHTV